MTMLQKLAVQMIQDMSDDNVGFLMRREQTLEEILDGKLYDSKDMVKADRHNCEGCCDCCQGMGDSVILDPFDVHRLSGGLEKPSDLLALT